MYSVPSSLKTPYEVSVRGENTESDCVRIDYDKFKLVKLLQKIESTSPTRERIPISVLVTPKNPGEHLPRGDPNLVKEALNKVTDGAAHLVKIFWKGTDGLVVLCRGPIFASTAERVLRLQRIGETEVETSIYKETSEVQGVIQKVSKDYSAMFILNELLDSNGTYHFIAVRRLPVFLSGQGKRCKSGSVVISFIGDWLPRSVKLWCESYQVTPFEPRVLQCYNCWRFGHVEKACRSARRCVTCSQSHEEGEESECTNPPSCRNCHGEHENDDPNCPKRAEEKAILGLKMSRKLPRQKAAALYKSMKAAGEIDVEEETLANSGKANRSQHEAKAAVSPKSGANSSEPPKGLRNLAEGLLSYLNLYPGQKMSNKPGASRSGNRKSKQGEQQVGRGNGNSQRGQRSARATLTPAQQKTPLLLVTNNTRRETGSSNEMNPDDPDDIC